MSKIMVKKAAAGEELRKINNPFEAATVVADGIGGAYVDDSTAKISFVEKVGVNDGSMVARFVLNLAIPRSSLPALHATISSLLEVDKDPESFV